MPNNAPTPHFVDDLIASRRATRNFLARPVRREIIVDILEVARMAPSALNTQPWNIHVLTGAAREQISAAVCAAHDAGDLRPEFPVEWFGPYENRRREFGARFYGLLGIERHERERLSMQQKNNYVFYGAPVGLIFTIDRRLSRGSWADYGMFLQNIMIAARARGLDTCPQGCWSNFPHVLGEHLHLGEHDSIVCGMALGYGNPEAIENTLTLDRQPVEAFAHFAGFE